MAIKEARPTEYKGIRFRSKCEAMFARYLELQLAEEEFLCSHKGPLFSGTFGNGKGGFVYEPTLPGWKPDFLVWRISSEYAGMPSMCIEIIEYKPSAPTDTYCAEFRDRAEKLVSEHIAHDCDVDEMVNAKFRIYFGSVWESHRGIIEAEQIGHEWIYAAMDEDVGDWLADFEEEVKSTRFDLASM